MDWSNLPAWLIVGAVIAGLVLVLMILIIVLLAELRKRNRNRPLMLNVQLDGVTGIDKAVGQMLQEIATWLPGDAFHAYWLSPQGDILQLVASQVETGGDPAVMPDYSGLVMDDTPLVPLSLPVADQPKKPHVIGSRAERWLEVPFGGHMLVRVALQPGQKITPSLLQRLEEAGRTYAPLMLALHNWFKAKEIGASATDLRQTTQMALDTTLHPERGAEWLLRVGGQIIQANLRCAVLAGPEGPLMLSDTSEGRSIAQRILQEEIAALTVLPEHPDVVPGKDLGPLDQTYHACVRVPIWLRSEPIGCFFYFVQHEPQLDEYLTTVMRTLGERTAHLMAGQLQLVVASENYAKTLRVLVETLDSLAPHSQGHSDRLARYARITAREMHLPESEVEAVAMAAYFHDVGMIAVDPRVILKPGRISQDDYERVKTHAELGAQLVGVVRSPVALDPMVAHHHERWDGYGYPAGLSGEAIPLGARIIAAADLLDAKTTSRTYRESLPFSQAVKDLREVRGRHLDPAVVDGMLTALQREQHEAEFGQPLARCWEMKQMPAHVCGGCPNRVERKLRCWESPNHLCARHGDTCESCIVYTEATSRKQYFMK